MNDMNDNVAREKDKRAHIAGCTKPVPYNNDGRMCCSVRRLAAVPSLASSRLVPRRRVTPRDGTASRIALHGVAHGVAWQPKRQQPPGEAVLLLASLFVEGWFHSFATEIRNGALSGAAVVSILLMETTHIALHHVTSRYTTPLYITSHHVIAD